MYRAKDFIETRQGLMFAVVAEGLEAGRIRCFLRYVSQQGHWRKLGTHAANQFLAEHYPQYLFTSAQLDADLHAVPEADVLQHHLPQQRLQQLLDAEPEDAVIADLQLLCQLLQDDGANLEQVGVTGSILPGLQRHDSDIDLVCYNRSHFQQIRNRVQALIARNKFQALQDEDWLAAFQRRACELSLDEYIWHEQRKFNKAMVNQRKFDLSLVTPPRHADTSVFSKLGKIVLDVEVANDEFAFDYPAAYPLHHPEIAEAVSFTATYIGQAQAGEWVKIAGLLEVDQQGVKRIVVGSDREALGEYIRVIR